MSQFTHGTINPATKSGTQLALDLASREAAVNSFHRGVARPSYAVAGMFWIDTSASPLITLQYYDGAADIPIRTIHETDNLAYLLIPSKTGAPSSAQKYQLHIDETGTPTMDLNIRNAANSAWVKMGQLASGVWTPYSGGVAVTPGGSLGQQIDTYTSGGTWTKPANLLWTDFFVFGGGGGGAAGGSGTYPSGGGGGGGGGFNWGRILEATLGATETITRGAGGAAGTGAFAAGVVGSPGGTSSVGTLLTALGGAGGLASVGLYAGGAGGTTGGTAPTFVVSGAPGQPGDESTRGGQGGSSLFGGGGAPGVDGGTGLAGSLYASGGGGGDTLTSGGNGANGVIIAVSTLSA